MTLHRKLRHTFLLASICTCLSAAESLPSVTAIAAPEGKILPVSAARSASTILSAQFQAIRRTLMLAGCKVTPLSEISAPDALAFETSTEIASSDVDGLMPEAAQALDALKEIVTSLGGTFELKSAYRPAAYQAHLHEVWVKWVKQLRNNRSSGCRALREEVGAEFARHQLLIRQQPVPASDHALGLAFDAAVAMPRAARIGGKRATVDKLAALAGIKRPNSRRDPVHFKLLPGRLTAATYIQPSSF